MNSMEPSEIIGLCVEEIIDIVRNEKSRIKNRDLTKICGKFGNFLSGEINPHIYHEIAETAINALIKRDYAARLLLNGNHDETVRELLRPLTERLPTQSWRSREQNTWQQFSTPPVIGYLLAYLLNFRTGDKVLEPSAGTGCLAVWPSGRGLVTHTNEIDPRRVTFLNQLGFTPTSYDAEFIDDFLPAEIEVDCLMMNPPFSSNGERTKNNSSKFGFRHVRSALERLKTGGRFGIILGEAGGLDIKTGNDFWRKLSDKIEVKSIIKIDGSEYYKMGTAVDVNLITGTKLLEPNRTDWNRALNKIKNISVRSVEEAFSKVKDLNLRLP